MKNKLMITGATGFLGTHVVRRLKNSDYELNLFAKHHDAASDVKILDLVQVGHVQTVVEKLKPHVIVHLGGVVNLSRDFHVAQACIDTNISGTLNLLEATRNAKPKLFIFVSTEETYGSAPIPYKEEFLSRPPSPYAMTKLAGENLCSMYGAYIGFPVIILRLGTMYGPGETEKRFIPGIITKALRDEDIPLNSGKKERDYLFVDDAVDALIACLNVSNPQATELINIGGGTSYTLKFIVEKIINICQSTSTIQVGVFPDRALESSKWLMDIKKAKKMLGWSPKTTLEVGLAKTIEYYKNKS